MPVKIFNHRCVNADYTVRLVVEMANGRRIILPEREVQAVYPHFVYGYWKSFSGGRAAITGFNMYHPFFILDHRKTKGRAGTIEYLVQWVGYDEEDTTWEQAQDLAFWSAELKDDYDEAYQL
ncbi:hypothetical protein FVEN_g828 [Fusarium venenatum]|uniref:Chromo domain-containing protein n=2 Tax=Fusarium venenatum TaxID=56646 RepID=A0A2L2TZM3_9HYPO|nr:uncharacterized protein FVRRES_10763 [Fusarium venenatum]KAG8361323.1 hypothetical protein FVEN_g828 [Fusarium venenatum]CEI70686.1 unnamed protein product [Fusarium venenatum]